MSGITGVLAVADAATVSAVEDAAEGLKDTLQAVGSAVLPFGAAVLALSMGWRFARRFVSPR